MQKHQWREDTEDGVRIYKAIYHAGKWVISTQLKNDLEWDETFKPDLYVWQQLRKILWAKYQRKRCSWKILETVDKLLQKEFGIDPPQLS